MPVEIQLTILEPEMRPTLKASDLESSEDYVSCGGAGSFRGVSTTLWPGQSCATAASRTMARSDEDGFGD